MNFDFPAFLVLATAITGGIWALDALFLAPRRRARADEFTTEGAGHAVVSERSRMPTVVEYARSFFPVILAVLLVRSFVVEPFRIPSGSMMPTLLAGDFILVNKFAYGLRLPVLHTEVVDLGEPQRGDIIVFRYPENPAVDYIKRVVGVPGDRIAYRDKVLYVNDERMEQRFIGEYVGDGAASKMNGASIYEERLGDVDHRILMRRGGFDRDFEFVVPEGQYFVLGDNRDNSRDSRFWGTVPEGHLVGRAFMIWMNWDTGGAGIHWSRIGDTIE